MLESKLIMLAFAKIHFINTGFLAHVKWFVQNDLSLQTPGLSSLEWLAISAAVVAGLVVLWLADKYLRKIDVTLDDKLERLKDWVPTIVRFTAAILLIIDYLQRHLFAQNIEYTDSWLSSLLFAVLAGIAILLIIGVDVQLAGAALIATYIISFLVAHSPLELLEHLEYVGMGAYLMFSEAGRWAIVAKKPAYLPRMWANSFDLGAPLFKFLAGVSLIILGFGEKLLNMGLAGAFMASHHSWNFLAGFGLSDRNFIIISAIVEILIGLSFVLNKAVRLTSAALLLTMVLTAILLGLTEIIGHLFALGLVAMIWIGPNQKSLFRLNRTAS